MHAGMIGATPMIAIEPVDPTLPLCDRPLNGQDHCTRKRGHYGPCGIVTVTAPAWSSPTEHVTALVVVPECSR